MIFSLFISAHPKSVDARSALSFARALIQRGHTLHRLFFQSEGILNSCTDFTISAQWDEFISNHHIDAVCCSASVQALGLLSENGVTHSKLLPSFEVSGLGQLIEASVVSDRTLTFGRHTEAAQ